MKVQNDPNLYSDTMYGNSTVIMEMVYIIFLPFLIFSSLNRWVYIYSMTMSYFKFICIFYDFYILYIFLNYLNTKTRVAKKTCRFLSL